MVAAHFENACGSGLVEVPGVDEVVFLLDADPFDFHVEVGTIGADPFHIDVGVRHIHAEAFFLDAGGASPDVVPFLVGVDLVHIDAEVC